MFRDTILFFRLSEVLSADLLYREAVTLLWLEEKLENITIQHDLVKQFLSYSNLKKW